jgi:hypothetical protein
VIFFVFRVDTSLPVTIREINNANSSNGQMNSKALVTKPVG